MLPSPAWGIYPWWIKWGGGMHPPSKYAPDEIQNIMLLPLIKSSHRGQTSKLLSSVTIRYYAPGEESFVGRGGAEQFVRALQARLPPPPLKNGICSDEKSPVYASGIRMIELFKDIKTCLLLISDSKKTFCIPLTIFKSVAELQEVLMKTCNI